MIQARRRRAKVDSYSKNKNQYPFFFQMVCETLGAQGFAGAPCTTQVQELQKCSKGVDRTWNIKQVTPSVSSTTRHRQSAYLAQPCAGGCIDRNTFPLLATYYLPRSVGLIKLTFHVSRFLICLVFCRAYLVPPASCPILYLGRIGSLQLTLSFLATMP